MVARGYARDFAERCFRQIEGFGTYGFPESHAASFALLVYVSAWLKCHHPAAFACALLNSQPMGFYAPAQIVRDAREHGVPVRGVDVNAERLGLHSGRGRVAVGAAPDHRLPRAWAEQLVEVRGGGGGGGGAGTAPSPVRLPQGEGGLRGRFAALAAAACRGRRWWLLAEADALRSLGLDRRAALWQVRGLSDIAELPLFADQPAAVRPSRRCR